MIDVEQAAEILWDVVVVGAGPAGTVAARQLALSGAQVLLVDRAPLGRRKTCGCCLNASALNALARVKLDGLIERLGAVPLSSLRVAAKDCKATVQLSGGASLSREAFDAALIREAIASGATFLAETNAAIGPCANDFREVDLTREKNQGTARAKVVLAADGLGGKLLARALHTADAAEPGSRIGAGVTLPNTPPWIQRGSIYMACSQHGYVGLVALDDGRLNVAAALDLKPTRDLGGPGWLASKIVAEVGWPEIAALTENPWQGTMALTRRAGRLWHEKVFVLGDAAGYVEPFTGEGMAWALNSAVAITPLALQALTGWEDSLGLDWVNSHRKTVLDRQSICRILAHALRHPLLVRAVIKMLSFQPGLANPVVRRLNAV